MELVYKKSRNQLQFNELLHILVKVNYLQILNTVRFIKPLLDQRTCLQQISQMESITDVQQNAIFSSQILQLFKSNSSANSIQILEGLRPKQVVQEFMDENQQLYNVVQSFSPSFKASIVKNVYGRDKPQMFKVSANRFLSKDQYQNKNLINTNDFSSKKIIAVAHYSNNQVKYLDENQLLMTIKGQYVNATFDQYLMFIQQYISPDEPSIELIYRREKKDCNGESFSFNYNLLAIDDPVLLKSLREQTALISKSMIKTLEQQILCYVKELTCTFRVIHQRLVLQKIDQCIISNNAVMIGDCRRRIRSKGRSKFFFRYDSEEAFAEGPLTVRSPQEIQKQGFFKDRKSQQFSKSPKRRTSELSNQNMETAMNNDAVVSDKNSQLIDYLNFNRFVQQKSLTFRQSKTIRHGSVQKQRLSSDLILRINPEVKVNPYQRPEEQLNQLKRVLLQNKSQQQIITQNVPNNNDYEYSALIQSNQQTSQPLKANQQFTFDLNLPPNKHSQRNSFIKVHSTSSFHSNEHNESSKIFQNPQTPCYNLEKMNILDPNFKLSKSNKKRESFDRTLKDIAKYIKKMRQDASKKQENQLKPRRVDIDLNIQKDKRSISQADILKQYSTQQQ
ncbi:UNKNOWN [Stylonychia lemnae]|uniref:Uncharacterized protein n=1 Tax=Stylonychia lemnae TaxID=5949 RepID=A0A078B1M2_STYLE|nr:UNKNOWN [Stylonychia lemnae]|eukprot:CDW88201.1 UNKNOWN [Stylonychia lemnae]